MSDKVEIHDGILENVMLFAGDVPGAKDKRLNTLDNELRDWKRAVDIKEFSVVLTAPTVFDYAVEHTDGREATGTITFAPDPDDPLISGEASPGWKVSESFPDSLRDIIISVINNLQMTSLTVEFF